jgi:hypothetical protein
MTRKFSGVSGIIRTNRPTLDTAIDKKASVRATIEPSIAKRRCRSPNSLLWIVLRQVCAAQIQLGTNATSVLAKEAAFAISVAVVSCVIAELVPITDGLCPRCIEICVVGKPAVDIESLVYSRGLQFRIMLDM